MQTSLTFPKKSALLLGGFLSCCLFCVSGTLSAQTVIYQQNFDSRTAGPYDDAALDEDWNEPRFNNGVTEGRVSVVTGDDAFGGTGSALAVDYPANVHGTRETGAQWQLDLGQSFEEVTLSYRVRFAPGFDFVRGGKIPGLAGGTAPTGSRQATGFNGWTGRMMWRTDFNGTSGQPQQLTTGGITYTKHTTSGFAGDGVQEDRNRWMNPDGSNTVMVADQWYKVTQRIVMNTPGEFDGIQQIFLDDVMVIDERNLRFRLDDSFAIDQVYFSTFYGGNENWRTSKAEVAFFDDFVVTVPDSDPVEPGNSETLLVPAEFGTIAAAIRAANEGDTIQFAGVHSENVTVNKSVRLVGDLDAVLVPADAAQPAIIIGASDVELANFEVDGGRQNIISRSGNENLTIDGLFLTNSATVGILIRPTCHGLTIRNTEIRNSGSDGLRVLVSDDVVLEDNFSVQNGGHGYRLIQSNNGTFTRNRTLMNGLHGYRLDGDRMMLMDNLALQNGLRGIDFDGGTDHFLFDNLARDNASHGIAFNEATNSLIFDNRSRSNGASGIRIWAGSNNNVLDDNNTTANGNHGILIGVSQGNSIINSFVFENQRSGILLARSTTGNSVTNNIVRSNIEFGIGDFGGNDSDVGNVVEDNGR